VQIGDFEEQIPDNRFNNFQKADDNITMFTKQLEIIKEIVMKGYDNLNWKIHSDKDTWKET
jgi:predicted transcriptional regulator